MTEWLPDWKPAGWKNSGGPVKNRELWEELDAFNEALPALEWLLRGHALHGLNGTADTLAKNAARGMYRDGEKSVRKQHPGWFR
ncbi:Ribonuclease H [compost metagenome]